MLVIVRRAWMEPVRDIDFPQKFGSYVTVRLVDNTMGSCRNSRTDAVLRVAYLFVIFFVALVCAARVRVSYDTLWHIPSGLWMLEHQAVLHHDVFSHTVLGRAWVAHEWLSEIVFALSYQYLGWTGVVLVAAASLAFAFSLLAAYLGGRDWPARGLLLLLVGVFLCMGVLIARPHALVAPVLVFWAIHLVAAVEQSRVPSLWLVPLMVLWANLHGSFLVGPVFAVVMGVEAITRASPIAERLRIAGRWASFTLLSLLACLLTPHGVR